MSAGIWPRAAARRCRETCRRHAAILTLIFALLSALLSACTTAPYRFDRLEALDVVARAEAQQQGPFRVRASVPGASEAERLFGVPTYDRGIQPVWIEVGNLSEQRARIILSSLDPRYFSPAEVAYIHRKRFSKQGWMEMEDRLLESGLPRQVGPGETVSGFVFTNASEGTKAFNVDVFLTGEARDFERFTFFITVPGFEPDHAAVDFQGLYEESEISDVDTDELRGMLQDLPRFTSNQDGSAPGRPVDLFLVANGRELLQALLRAGWSETSYDRDAKYFANADYLYNRPPDAILRKSRDRSTERAELLLWLAPVRVDGRPLWAAQFRHAIGRRFAIGERLFGATPDPDVTDGRNYMMQDLWYAQALERWAFSGTGVHVPADATRVDFRGDPWFTQDALRLVLWIADSPIALREARVVDWGRYDAAAGDAR